MSISSEISRISGNVSDALTAIADKGVAVPSGANSDDLADLITAISGGSSTNSPTYYGTSSTGASTAQKEVTISGITELTAGLAIRVKFSNENTASNPTLKLNTFSAIAIYTGSSAAGNTAATSWTAGSVVTLTYDGSNWVINNFNNTTYSAMTLAEMQTGTGTGGRIVSALRVKQAVEYHGIAKPSSPATGAFLVYDGTDWVAQTLSTWQGGNY